MEDKQLVRLAQEGSPEAYEELVTRYQSKVYSMALSFTRNREAADDLAQEVFLKAYLALPRFHGKSEFGTWLYRISINHIRDYLRKKGRAKEVSLDDVAEVSFSDREQAERAEMEKETEARRTLVQTFVQEPAGEIPDHPDAPGHPGPALRGHLPHPPAVAGDRGLAAPPGAADAPRSSWPLHDRGRRGA
ncbi:MAG: sigma-70 family RNA polymerase sigma factor [Desulfomicrobium escambiense]|nr:sigma-70 family RNA polymerase sigma factor [Desulfomicrobium escambiense]